ALVDGIRELALSLDEHEVFQPLMVSSPIFADGSAPVTRGTFEAASYAAGCALAAAAAVEQGDEVSVALCRPPGHHAGRSFCGGFCYFNNAALAAQRLSRQGTVGILDIDYHHGHGTQDIFYAQGDVAYASLHADPRHEYPYHFGRPGENGTGQGRGWNLNLPLPQDCDQDLYLAALDQALAWLAGKGTKSLVVSLGFDTCKLDPFGGLGLDTSSYRTIAQRIRTLEKPTVIVFEGGYNITALGPCWGSFINGL
ncbi:MAG TPA: hypothetical protein VMF29_05125, partial [Candidatus Edwardsbacteria bacterium]|nr:hypothetical protein [Candidatus Edwardsbacteria bacterium]